MLAMTSLMNLSNGSIVMNPTHGGKSDDLLMEYLGQLTCAAVSALYRRYLPDFVLFKYQMEGMVRWVNGGRGCGVNILS